jgi:hypothetical protein
MFAFSTSFHLYRRISLLRLSCSYGHSASCRAVYFILLYSFKEFERVVQHHLLYVSVCLSVFPPVCLSVASFSLFYPTVCIVMFFLVQDVAK